MNEKKPKIEIIIPDQLIFQIQSYLNQENYVALHDFLNGNYNFEPIFKNSEQINHLLEILEGRLKELSSDSPQYMHISRVIGDINDRLVRMRQ